MSIIWTKDWVGADDGTILKAIDLKNIQDDLSIVQTVNDALSIPGQANGDILYYNGSDWVRIAAGTSGQVLTSAGAGAPAWANDLPADFAIAGQLTGDLLYFNGTNWVRLPSGATGEVLTSNGTVTAPSYQTPSTPAGLDDYVPGALLEGRNKGVQSGTTNAAFTKVLELCDLPRSGIVDIKYYAAVASGGQTGAARMYINGVATGTNNALGSPTYTEYTDSSVAVTTGDNIQIYLKSDSDPAWGMRAIDLRVYVSNPTQLTDISVVAGTTLYGTGVPDNTIGVQGDIYLRSDGGAATSLYVKTAVATWTAK